LKHTFSVNQKLYHSDLLKQSAGECCHLCPLMVGL
jgi:hypothetical protein